MWNIQTLKRDYFQKIIEIFIRNRKSRKLKIIFKYY